MGKVHYLRWEIYKKEKGWFIKKYFWWLFRIQKGGGGGVLCTSVEDNVVGENQEYK